MNRQYPMFLRHAFLSVFFAATCRADTVLHLSFDDAVSESGVSVKSGNAVYSTDTPGPQVFWLIDGVERAKRANTKSLSMNCASLDLLFEDERLMAPNLLNATIEFFIKGISAKTWECPLSISAGGQPYPLLVQAWDNGRYYFRADTYSTTVNQHAINSDCRYNDGLWHHIAMTVSAVEGGVSEIRFYADYVLVGSALTTISSWQGFTKDMFLRIGAANSNYLIDEFRVSDTFLQPESFLKLEPEARDGDTLLHLSFDNGDFNSLARPTESPSLISGTPSFSDDVPHAVIWTEEGKVSRSNNKSFRAANNAITLKIPENNLIKTQSLLKPNLNEMTFEFFYKAISASGSWLSVFHLGGSAGQYLLQVNGSARCYHRVDTTANSNDSRFFTDERRLFADNKWHHVALTISEADDGVSVLCLYVDHEKIFTTTTATRWDGLGEKKIAIGHANVDMLVDEIRITKGVLPIAKFLPGAPDTADKETLVYMPFDGNLQSIGRSDAQPLLYDGKPVFTANRCFSRIDDGSAVRDNTGALQSDGVISLSIPSNAMLRPYLDSATIEFFVKGVSCSAWDGVLSFVNNPSAPGTPPFPLLFQVEHQGHLRVRFDGFADVNSATDREELFDVIGTNFADNKWHHYAVTIAPTETGQTRYTAFRDYQPVWTESLTSTKYPFLGLTEGMVMRIGGAKFHLDELRITKGVLDPEQFIRKSPFGLVITIE